ncbi:DUF2628 domain-containing protein [Clostridium perfringens]
MTRLLVRYKDGDKIYAPVGFSWTVFFFGAFVPLLRGDFKWFIIMLFLQIGGFNLLTLLFMFKYNQWYIDDLIAKGYSFWNDD